MEEEDVDAAGAEGFEAAVEGVFRLLRGEDGVGWFGCGGWGSCVGEFRGGSGGGEALLEAGELFDDRSQGGAGDAGEGTAGVRGDAELGGDGELAGVAGEELAEAGFGLAVAIHGGDVVVADAGVVSGFEHGEGVAAAECSHDAGAAEA